MIISLRALHQSMTNPACSCALCGTESVALCVTNKSLQNVSTPLHGSFPHLSAPPLVPLERRRAHAGDGAGVGIKY